MYSMNYIGKFIANFREFYNEINGATLTGAIDVVVVEQPDGTFTCSPFHVRFGKLGVLRSRFKVVDLELNGEPLSIHMKLGESGEAFFVEEVGENEAECSAHLATSPIPAGPFDDYEPRRRNSLSAVEPDHGQASDYTKRRYTADGQSMQKPNISKLTRKDVKKEDIPANLPDEHDALFEMEGLDEVAAPTTDWADSVAPKTFAATQLGEAECHASQAVLKISEHNDFRPIESVACPDDGKQGGNGKKKKKTRKVSSKKKHQRKSSSSSISSQSERAGSEQRAVDSTPVASASDVHFFSDTELNAAVLSEEMSNLKLSGETRIPLALSDTAFEVQPANKHANSRDGTPVQSDTEVELGRGSAGDKSSQSWRWGELPSPPPRAAPPPALSAPEPASLPLSSDEERGARSMLSGMFRFMAPREPATTATAAGVYLDDLDGGQVDMDLYFPKHHADKYRTEPVEAGSGAGPTEEEYESGNGPSLPQSPASPASPATHIPDYDDSLLTKGEVGVYVREAGAGSSSVSRSLPYEEFCERGGELVAEGRLLVRLGDRYLPWRSAGPLLLSLLAFRRPLPARVIESLEKCKEEGEGRRGSDSGKARGYSWWSWRRSNVDPKLEPSPTKGQTKDPAKEPTPSDTISTTLPDVKQEAAVTSSSPIDVSADIQEEMNDIEEVVEPIETIVIEDSPPKIDTERIEKLGRAEASSSDSEAEGHPSRRPARRHSTFRKTLRLSSKQIEKLSLREGMNEMVFSVTTAYQGTTRCKCNVFRWRHDDKVVISDIDGTITKSDVLGHIFPLVGKDWAQSGVAQLFTKIKNNGYQILYLSARAIGQARVTREYLRSIRQGEVCLPDGPLLLNPTSLLRAFHREVIEKKPEEFKIQCLADIKALFPVTSNPFYAGYGNRVNDVCAYQAVGIPIVRIFTINYKGELKHELTQTFQSTYSHMSVLVDQVFPPALCEPTDEFSQTVFWRDPLPPVATSPLALALK